VGNSSALTESFTEAGSVAFSAGFCPIGSASGSRWVTFSGAAAAGAWSRADVGSESAPFRFTTNNAAPPMMATAKSDAAMTRVRPPERGAP
jgi:hypothetical protein